MPSLANLPQGIELWSIRKWENKHQNFKQKLEKNASFYLRNANIQKSTIEDYRQTTQNLQWLIAYALEHKLRLRALGKGWSFSKVGVTKGGLVDTNALRMAFRIKESQITPAYLQKGKTSQDLFFVQCGISIEQLNQKLEKEMNPPRSLKASGASNGQTIAGALSTGTHGAAFKVGAIQEQVVGLHIVVGKERHVWLEKASYPVVSEEFAQWIHTGKHAVEVVKDDTLFNAALVSFGSFGFIHGVMLETEPLFLLKEVRKKDVPYNPALQQAMQKLDFSQLDLEKDGKNKDLYHFEVVVNPHNFAPDDPNKGVFLKTIYKHKYRSDYPRISRDTARFTYGEDTLGVIQTILDKITVFGFMRKALIPRLVNTLFPLAYAAKEPFEGTMGETFTNTKFRGKVGSAALGLDIRDAVRVLEEILQINSRTPFAGGFSLRYVKGTQALLGFTRFPDTCVLELDGVDSRTTRNFLQKLWDRLETLSINYTLHWGKINFNLNEVRIRRMYGDDAVNHWIESRNKLLDAPTRNIFSNEFIERCGLNKNLPVPT